MLTSKQRAYLRSIANNIEPIFQIGKAGASPELVSSIDEALEAREIIKATVLNNCGEDVRELAQIIGERTRSDVVQVIGKKIIFYRENAKKPIIELPKAGKKELQ